MQTRLAPPDPASGTSVLGFEVLNSPTVPNSFLQTVLRVVQAWSAWFSALSRGSPPTEIRRWHVLRFPRPQDKHYIFRMQQDASLNPCDGLSHRGHTCTRAWQYEGSTSIEDHNVTFCQSLLTQQAGACGPWTLGISLGLRCRSHRVVRYRLLLSILQDCLSFHLQGPRIFVPSLIPLTVSVWTFGPLHG